MLAVLGNLWLPSTTTPATVTCGRDPRPEVDVLGDVTLPVERGSPACGPNAYPDQPGSSTTFAAAAAAAGTSPNT
jgi:hypothetical protein